MIEDEASLSDDIVPDIPKHASFEREFAPWHKVRKEFVRREQWNRLIIQYAERYLRKEINQRPLACLVIPGDDLLDIRSLLRDTEALGFRVRYLGFNSRHGSGDVGTPLHVAHNDVTTAYERVDSSSLVIRDPFQRVGSVNSRAFLSVKEIGPFHIINLDLCDSLFPTASGDLPSYFRALHGIAAYQMREMTKPWLLFITTEVSPKEVDVEQFDYLCKPTKQNVQKYEEFDNLFSKVIPSSVLTSGANGKLDCSQLNPKQLVDLFGVAIGKALLSFCANGQGWKVGMRKSHIYTINMEKQVSMLSLAFEFTPIFTPPEDVTGLSSLKLEKPKPFNELELATRLLKSVLNISNIDDLLKETPLLHDELLNSSADLLKSAGYDRDKYIQWVQEGEQTKYL